MIAAIAMHFTVVSRRGEIRCLNAPAVVESRPRRANIFRVTNSSFANNWRKRLGGLPLLASLVKVTQMYAQDRMSLEGLGRLVKLIYQKD